MKYYYIIYIFICICVVYYIFKNIKLKQKSKIVKSYYINISKKSDNISYIMQVLDNILYLKKWNKINSSNMQTIKNIGFVFSNDNNILNSQINYGIYSENVNIFNNNTYFKDYFLDNDYFSNEIVLKKNQILLNVENLYNLRKDYKNNLYILKDSITKEKILFSFDENKENIIEKIEKFTSNFIIMEEYFESIKFSVPELSYNNEKLNIENKKERRSMIRFFILVIIRNNNIEFYKIKDYLIYLSIIPISSDINKLSSYFVNYTGEKNNLTKNEKLNYNTYNNFLSNESKYPTELFSQIFCISNNKLKKNDYKLSNLLNMSIDKFINDFSATFHKELISENDSYFNNNFISGFDIFTIDSIFTNDNKLKILKIRNDFNNLNLKIFESNNNIFNINKIFSEILNLIIYNNTNSNQITLINKLNKKKINKTYYLSEFQVKTYPEYFRLLKERNYTRSIWRNNIINSIDLYIGYINKNKRFDELNKNNYISYLYSFYQKYNIVNKIQGAIYKLGDKTMLYRQFKDTNLIADFVDFTILKNDNDENFIKTSELLKVQNFINVNQTTCNRFILKPSQGSQGDGIEIIRFYEDFEKWIKTSKKYKDWTLSEFLLPKTFYSNKILDNKKRKAHVRSYFIITNHKNNIKVYELRNRIIYFAVDKYISKCVKIDNENKYSFITNLALASEERNMDYDTKQYSDDLLNYQDQIFNFKKLSDYLTSYGLECIKLLSKNDFNCFNKNNPKSKGCFQIIAIDYLPINKNQVKLLEVNKGPGFKALKVNFNL